MTALDAILARAARPVSHAETVLAEWLASAPEREARVAFELPATRAAIARALAADAAKTAAIAKEKPWTPPSPDPEAPLEFDARGRLVPAADFDDSFAIEEARIRVCEDWARGAELTFMDVMENETGMFVSDEKYRKRLDEKLDLRIQSDEICDALERAGVPMLRRDTTAAWRYHVHSGHYEELPHYRRVMINPHMAAMARAPKLAAIEHHMSLFAPWQFRFWTFTSGKRCKSHEIRSRCQWMFRRLSKLNARFAKMGFPCEFIFRSCEFGKTEKTDKSGQKTGGEILRIGRHVFYHPHIHTILFVREFMSPARWDLLLSVTREFWRRDGERLHWDAGEMIQNPRECVKYVTKPGDMLALARGNSRELRRLYEATARLRMATPMGELKKRIRARKDAGLILVRKTTGEGCVWLEVRNPDKSLVPDERTGKDKLLADAREIARLARRSPKPFCEVVKRCMPTVGPQRVKEPTVIVIGNTLDKEHVRRHPLVARIREHTAAAYRVGLVMARIDDAQRRPPRGACSDQSSHGHINCPRDFGDGAHCGGSPPKWEEIDHDYVWEADENPIPAN
ncbi:MAG: protein rep [Kiritimatiellaeota bacterium]|nr:protein rep [Kiritimatiellota bacterium]